MALHIIKVLPQLVACIRADLLGYVEFDGNRRFAAVRKLLPRAHWEPANGSAAHNKHYCNKPVAECGCSHCVPPPVRLDGPWEHGTVAQERQGARHDLVKFRDAIKSGKRKRELLDDDELASTVMTHKKLYEELRSVYKPAVSREVDVRLLYGPSGCGKTTDARTHTTDDNLWVSEIGGTSWFDGYDGEEAALFDDFGGAASHTRLDSLLRLLHEWVERVPVKGGHVWFVPKTIFITTNIHPRDWFDWTKRESQYAALRRRVTRLDTWRSDGVRRAPLGPGDRLFEAFWTTFDIAGRSAPPEREDGPMGGYRLVSRPGDERRQYDWLDDFMVEEQ